MAWRMGKRSERAAASRRGRGGRGLGRSLETLEARHVMAAQVMITEIVADNQQGLRDEDGDRVDWLELFNAGDAPADLGGWRLTDDARERNKWVFPPITLNPDEYLVVFASGKDRRDAQGQLHTNFQLSSSGEYLGLIRADGATIEFEFAPQYPALLPDRSFGYAQTTETLQLVRATDPLSVLVPTPENQGNQLGTAWIQPTFDDTAWTHGANGVGYESATGLAGHFQIDLQSQMLGKASSAYLRVPFTVENPSAILSLTLEMKYDDGYAAYANGVDLSRRNTPTTLDWNSLATTTHRDTLAVVYEPSDISAQIPALQAGSNLLAIHGLNNLLTSDDFLIAAEMHAEVPAAVLADQARFFAEPTPARPNGLESYGGLIEPATVSVERGFFEQPFDVTLTSRTPGATLVYTTDGSEPTKDNGIAVAPPDAATGVSTVVHIARTTTLRVAAVRDDNLSSRVSTYSYLNLTDILQQDSQATIDAGYPPLWGRVQPDYGLDPDVIGPNDLYEGEFSRQMIDALKAAPSVSLVLNRDDLFGDAGLYSNSTRAGEEWERETSFEFLTNDGSGHVQANAGLRIQGDNVRNLANSLKQSFRIEFRHKYGTNNLQFPVFGAENPDAVESFDTLILRGGYNDSWSHTPSTTQYIRDQWARSTLLAMGQPQVHGRFVHVYLNGFYWGVYTMVERANASFGADYGGGEPEDWDTLNTGAIRDGNRTAWTALQAQARLVDRDDPKDSNDAFLRMLGRNPDGSENPEWETLLDVDNYVDYLIVNFYGGNTDWPARNYYAGRRRGPESNGFMFFAWDTEKILDHGEGADLTVNRTTVSDGSALPYRYLRTNEEFRLWFADRVHRHFFNGGALYVDPQNPQWDPAAPERNRPAAQYDTLARRIELPLIAESARWGDTQPTGTRNDGRIYTVRDWRTMRDSLFNRFFPQRSAIVLQQLIDAGLYPSTAAPVFGQHGGKIATGFQLEVTGPGDVYYTLDGSDPRQGALEGGPVGGQVAPTARRYSGPIPLDRSVIVKSRTLLNGQWSALNEATFQASTPAIGFAELMYHPRGASGAETFGDEEYEFIELVNRSSAESFELQGMQLTGGIEFTFPAATVAAGERVVVARNTAAFQQRYGTEILVVGQYGGTADDFRLNNGGEALQLVDAFGVAIQEITYADDWHPSTDGDGFSLTVVDPNAPAAEFSLASNWRPSTRAGGSPGRADVLDFDGDGVAGVSDIDRFSAGYRANDPTFDLTGDALVSSNDWVHLIQNLLGTAFGDADLDGRFNSRDLVRVFQAGEYEDAIVGNSGWAEGDWDGDGDFTSRDLVFALSAGGYAIEARPIAAQASRVTDSPAAGELTAGELTADVAVRDVVFALEADTALSGSTPRRRR